MTVTASTRLRGKNSRAAQPVCHQRRRSIVTGVAIGLGCTSLAAAAIGTGIYLGTKHDAPSETRARLAAAFAQTVVAKTASAIDARFPARDDRAAALRSTERKADANPTFAFAIPASAQVGSRTDASRPAAPPAPRLASVALYNPKAADNASPQPSRARTQLASLTPPDGLNVAPQDDTAGERTAIYDITAQAVYMPNGEKLEAHSGFGDFLDNPKHVSLKMRGATPPNSYRLTMREARFHGVEAIRMTPENEDVMYKRDGILAHPYMLGPNGQSNGCISFKDYGKFLAAFKRGEVDRIVVVARLDKPPESYARANPNIVAAWLKKIF
jgi:hypothetical protein